MEVGSSASSYEILAKIAEGGMAEIFLARSKTGAGVERMVVLKRVLRHAAQDEDLVRLFVAEARLAAQLQHPNVVQVYDVGKLGSSYFFSMEYVHGETVRDLMLVARHRGLELPIATVMTLAAGAAAGLSHAHARRGLNGKPLAIVHADISPSNLMITYDGVLKIVDFGIAKAEHHTADVERPLQGKLCYMSPEQARSRPLDRRSDLFSLGIVLWELLTLQGLYRGNSDFNVMDMIINEPPPPPSRVRPDVPRDVDEIVLRLLAKDPAARYQSAAELLDAIEVATMRMSTLLSTASVARQMREWFGKKDEPWIEQTVGGSIKRVVVDSEPVPSSLTMTIAGPLREPVDDLLETLAPSHTKPPPVEGAPAWDNPTLDGEALRERLIRELNLRMPQHPTSDPAMIPDDAATIAEPQRITLLGVAEPEPVDDPLPAPPTSPMRAPVMPAPVMRAPVMPAPVQHPDVLRRTLPGTPAPTNEPPRRRSTSSFPSRRPPSTSEGRSKLLLVLVALGITFGIGGIAFFVLWKTQLADRPASSRSSDVERFFNAGDHENALNACLGSTPSPAQLPTCAIAACTVKDAFHARRWRDAAPDGERARISERCRERGVDLDAPSP